MLLPPPCCTGAIVLDRWWTLSMWCSKLRLKSSFHGFTRAEFFFSLWVWALVLWSLYHSCDIVSWETWYRHLCIFTAYVQTVEFLTGGLPSGCRKKPKCVFMYRQFFTGESYSESILCKRKCVLFARWSHYDNKSFIMERILHGSGKKTGSTTSMQKSGPLFLLISSVVPLGLCLLLSLS